MSDPQNPADPTPPADQPPPAYTPPPAAEPAPPAYSQQPASAPTYGQQPYAGSSYPVAPPPAYGAPASATIPGRTMGIVAFILSFFVQLVALILGIVALVQSRKAGHKNGWAVAAIIISVVLMVLGVVLFFAIAIPLLTFSSEALQACQAVDFSGSVQVRGITVDCSTISR
jgi:hypothetical protein